MIEDQTWGTVANLTIDGGRVGLAFTGSNHDDGISPTLQSYVAGSNFFRITFRNQSFAGVQVGNDDPELMGGAEHDQNKYVELTFENTGSYGIYMNQNMLDKWLCLHCDFSGQKKGGISIKFNNLIHGGIIGCSFRDIDGPGLDLMGGNPEIRFRPHQVMVDQCSFTECGNASSPAVDEGAGVTMGFTRCQIVTKSKAIRAGLMSGAAIYEDVNVDVKTPDNAPTILLRGPRNNQTGRPNGATLRNVVSTGGFAFVNDANAYNDLYEKTARARGFDPNLDWDVNAAAHELAPPNGWVHPFMLYKCRFGDKSFDYNLINANTDTGEIIKNIDLSPLAR